MVADCRHEREAEHENDEIYESEKATVIFTSLCVVVICSSYVFILRVRIISQRLTV